MSTRCVLQWQQDLWLTTLLQCCQTAEGHLPTHYSQEPPDNWFKFNQPYTYPKIRQLNWFHFGFVRLKQFSVYFWKCSILPIKVFISYRNTINLQKSDSVSRGLRFLRLDASHYKTVSSINKTVKTYFLSFTTPPGLWLAVPVRDFFLLTKMADYGSRNTPHKQIRKMFLVITIEYIYF